jgi:hypothetical protein
LLPGDASVCSDKMAALEEKTFCVLEYHRSKSVVTVQRVFRAKYAKDPPTDTTIRARYKQFNCKRKSNGRALTVEDDGEQVRSSFLHTPKKSTGTAAKELSMLKITVPLRQALWFSCYKCL